MKPTAPELEHPLPAIKPAPRLTKRPPLLRLRNARRGGFPWLALGLAVVCFCLHSPAATVVVTAQNFNFSPSAVTIGVGDSVTFFNAGGNHNVIGYNPAPPPERFCGGTLAGPGPMCNVTFTNPGVFQFRCEPHSSGSGTSFSGMIGSITVTSPPPITVVPSPSYLFPGGDLTLSLTYTLSPAPTYQWQFNGTNLPGATGSTLALRNVTTNDSGLYRVTLSNAFEVVTTSPATVQVLDRLTILSHPRHTNAPAGSNALLSVTALSPSPISYQWQFNGTNLPGATQASLVLTNLQFDAHTGYYRVLVSDSTSSVLSDTATVVVLVRPTITSQPVAQTVLQGATAVFSVSGGPDHPLLPLTYRWLRNGVNWASNVPPMLVITNCQTNGSFRCQLINAVGSVTSATVGLTVLPDYDGDGLADAWETNYFGLANTTNNPANALEDPDGDGMSNRDEYNAGTNPTNAASVLKLQLSPVVGGQAALSFLAMSNRTYTVEWNTQVIGGTWIRLQDVLALPALRQENLTDTNATSPRRFYQVITPKRP